MEQCQPFVSPFVNPLSILCQPFVNLLCHPFQGGQRSESKKRAHTSQLPQPSVSRRHRGDVTRLVSSSPLPSPKETLPTDVNHQKAFPVLHIQAPGAVCLMESLCLCLSIDERGLSSPSILPLFLLFFFKEVKNYSTVRARARARAGLGFAKRSICSPLLQAKKERRIGLLIPWIVSQPFRYCTVRYGTLW